MMRLAQYRWVNHANMQNDESGDRRGEPGPLREYAVVKRSVVVGGHKTSVSLEDAFWTSLKDIATRRGITLSTQIASIDTNRRTSNLSSAICLYVLEHFRTRAVSTMFIGERHMLNAACAAWPKVAPLLSAREQIRRNTRTWSGTLFRELTHRLRFSGGDGGLSAGAPSLAPRAVSPPAKRATDGGVGTTDAPGGSRQTPRR